MSRRDAVKGRVPATLAAGYAEYPPPLDLASYVAAFWSSYSPGAPDPAAVHRILPDGCVDIVLGFADSASAGPSAPLESMGVGPMTRPAFIRGAVPRLYIGVRFRPGCAFVALGIPATDIVDTQVGFDALSTNASRDLSSIAGATTDADRLAAMVELVRSRLRTLRAVPRGVRAAVRAIVDAHGDLRIASLAADIGITRQGLARQFATHVGVSPKTLARVMRAQAALARADAAGTAYSCPRDVDWMSIAYELGYYDQSHFIDDFKALTGSTPGEWILPFPGGRTATLRDPR